MQILLRARAIGVIQVPPSRHLSSLLFLSSQCPCDVIPVPSSCHPSS
ncbi:MAG: hypothetical protein ACEY3L_06515 [Wolbachia sp.]